MKRAACCRPRKRQPSTSTVDVDQKKSLFLNSKIMKFFLFQDFDFLRYFWHKNPNQALMPKVPKKVKILTNKKNHYFRI